MDSGIQEGRNHWNTVPLLSILKFLHSFWWLDFKNPPKFLNKIHGVQEHMPNVGCGISETIKRGNEENIIQYYFNNYSKLYWEKWEKNVPRYTRKGAPPFFETYQRFNSPQIHWKKHLLIIVLFVSTTFAIRDIKMLLV